MAERIPNAKLAFFEDSGHVAFVEDRLDWNRELAAFIDETAEVEQPHTAGT